MGASCPSLRQDGSAVALAPILSRRLLRHLMRRLGDGQGPPHRVLLPGQIEHSPTGFSTGRCHLASWGSSELRRRSLPAGASADRHRRVHCRGGPRRLGRCVESAPLGGSRLRAGPRLWVREASAGAHDYSLARCNERAGDHEALRVAIDIGGTFTDLVPYDETADDHLWAKTPSTPPALHRRRDERTRQSPDRARRDHLSQARLDHREPRREGRL